MEIHTKRLFIRPFLDHDEETMLRLLTDSKIKETYMIPDFDCMEKVLRLFKRYQELSKAPERIVGAITLDDHVIGFFNDTGIRDGYIELGYVIDPAFHNQGYMTEALTALIAYLFEHGFREVGAGAFVENPASLRVMEKSGMVRQEKEDDIEYRGVTHHCVYYHICK